MAIFTVELTSKPQTDKIMYVGHVIATGSQYGSQC